MSVDTLSERRQCLRDCERTYNEFGARGHVRRCEHGRIWRWCYRFGQYQDHWVPLWRIQFIAYPRAVRALAAAPSEEE